MTTTDIIDVLRSKETDYLKTKEFSPLPGIYAFFFIGNDFPILGKSVSKHQIIYIGKTESSQENRDAKTHFSTGKTGSSTVRKSIGSLLFEKEKLKPIPRNDIDYSKGRFSHFKFDKRSEEIITSWMEENLSLAFFEYPKSKAEIEKLENEIINLTKPVLNISKNPLNSFNGVLQNLRKKCAMMAAQDFFDDKKEAIPKIKQSHKIETHMGSEGKYTDLWSRKREAIKQKLIASSQKQSIQLNSEEFENVGNRNNYSFNLEFTNGTVSNNIGGSAVARDLAKILESSAEIMAILKFGYFKIKMDKGFCLWIERI